MVKLKNISETEQTFTGFPPFAPGVIPIDFTEAEAEMLLRSHFIEKVDGAKPVKGIQKDKSFRAVEKDD